MNPPKSNDLGYIPQKAPLTALNHLMEISPFSSMLDNFRNAFGGNLPSLLAFEWL